MDRAKAARHLAEREALTEKAIVFWQQQTERVAKLSAARVSWAIIEAARQDAVAAYEAMLDTVVCERTALHLLDAARRANPTNRRPPRKPNA